jgi:GT2 family glycosyltransferase
LLEALKKIAMLCCGMLEHTKRCVASVLEHSREPFELVFVDVGSLDGTNEYLQGLKAGLAGRIRVEIVRTPTDLGIGDACKDALGRTRGDYLVLLNNDCVVTNAWLNQLVGLATFSPTMGLVGPMSNYAAESQLVAPGPYHTTTGSANARSKGGEASLDLAAVEQFARKHREEQAQKWVHVERLSGFCLLAKRELLAKVGPSLEPWTDLKLFDTDILSAKAREAGYQLAVARNLFVHHFGTRTFSAGSSDELRSS